MQNLRSTFLKIIKRAGLKAWPKLFQNLRSTRETELAETFPLQAVTAWIGNSQLVAAKHYLQLRDEHFDRTSSEVTHPTTKTPGEGHSQGHNAGLLKFWGCGLKQGYLNCDNSVPMRKSSGVFCFRQGSDA